MRLGVTAAVVLGVVSVGVEPVRAQSSVLSGRVELAIGPLWTRGALSASGDAIETTPAGGSFHLFTTATTLAAATAVEGRLGVRITRHLEAQAAGSYGTPQLRVAVTNDVEDGAPVTATERIQQFEISAGALWYPPFRTDRSRLAPFISAEAGYLRELHEQHALVESGRVYQFGGGVKCMLLTRSGRLKGIGARLDARAVLRSKGIAFDDRLHAAPALGASLYLRF